MNTELKKVIDNPEARTDFRISKAKEVLALLEGLTHADAEFILGYANSSLSEKAIICRED